MAHLVPPPFLAPGTLVGSWRLLSLASRGARSAVFRVERSAQPEQGSFALKLALLPGDPHFALQIELLSRTQHPSVPRLHDSGQWSGPGGAVYPFFVMDWVEGLPLYSWARLQDRSPRELLRVLAQVAGALQAVHAADGLHRDIKGDNILVRPEDGHATLVDFGACTLRGAPALAHQREYPGSPQYQSPQSQLHAWKYRREAGPRYEGSAEDDVYALGVAAYRVAAGRYPLVAEDIGSDDEVEDLFSHFPELVPAEALVKLSPELARWIRRMLCVEPAARGTSEALASGLAHSAATEGPAADEVIFPRMPVRPSGPQTRLVSSLEDLPWWKGAKGLSMLALLVVGGLLHPVWAPRPGEGGIVTQGLKTPG